MLLQYHLSFPFALFWNASISRRRLHARASGSFPQPRRMQVHALVQIGCAGWGRSHRGPCACAAGCFCDAESKGLPKLRGMGAMFCLFFSVFVSPQLVAFFPVRHGKQPQRHGEEETSLLASRHRGRKRPLCRHLRERRRYLFTDRTVLHPAARHCCAAALRYAALLGCAASGSPLECSAGFPLFVALVMLTPSPLPLPCLDRSHHITYWGPDSTWLGEEDEGCMCVCVCGDGRGRGRG